MCCNLESSQKRVITKEDKIDLSNGTRRHLTSCSKEKIQNIPFNSGDVLGDCEARATIDDECEHDDIHFCLFSATVRICLGLNSIRITVCMQLSATSPCESRALFRLLYLASPISFKKYV
jgi:hypothetical protein